MNITREDMPGRQVALTIELPMDTVNEALDKAYRQMVNQVNVPGFRKGKAPRYMLESYIGKDMLTERAVNNILPQTVQDAIKEQDIEAMDVGDVEIISMDPVQVKVIIVQPPVVELGDYGSIRVEKEETPIGEEQVEQVLTELRREGVPWNEPAEPRPAREGDMVYLNLEGFTTEGELEEAKREEFPTIVGMQRGGVPEVVSNALAGMSVGEEKDITDVLPEDYPNEALRGKDVTYHVAVLSMKEQALPELDEEFSKKLNFDTMDALREAIESNLKQRAQETSESNQVETIISRLVESATADVPEVMVNEELDGMLKRLEERLKEQRLTIRQYLSYNGLSEAEWREANREHARSRVVRTLVLQEFARREGIEVDDTEIEGEIDGIINRFEGAEQEQARNVLGRHEARHDVEDRLFQRKLVERLVAIAEGQIEAAAPTSTEAEAATPDVEAKPKKSSSKKKAGAEEPAEDTDTGAATLEEAGGAAELLGTEGVDLKSPNETGDASGGGTPSTAPSLDDKK